MTWRVNTTMNDDIAILGRLTAGPAREVDLVAAAIADGSSYHQAVDRVHAVAADLLKRQVIIKNPAGCYQLGPKSGLPKDSGASK